MILRLAQVASPTRLAQPRSHTEWEDPKSQGITRSTDWNQHARRAGSVSRGWDAEGFLGSAYLLVPLAVPGLSPSQSREGHQPPHPPWREGSWGRAHWVGHPLWLFSGLALPSAKWPARPYHILNTHLCRTHWWRDTGSRPWECWAFCSGEGWPWPHLNCLQLWLLRFNVQSLKKIEIVTRRNNLYTTLKLYSVSCSGLEMDFFNESGN